MFPPPEPAAHELNLEELPRDTTGFVDWPRVFGTTRPLRVEIGVGLSTFLIEVAEGQPGYSYVGFEYSPKCVARFLKKVEARGVQNIRMIRANVTRWLAQLFPPSSIERFYINHPDPWPKRRHGKNRLINSQNALLLSNLLLPGGKLSLRTDFARYAQQILTVLDSTPGLRNVFGGGTFAPMPLDTIVTHYEGKFLKAGQPIYYLEYEKPGAAAMPVGSTLAAPST